MERRIVDRCRKLSVSQDICVSADRTREVGVDGAREAVVPEGVGGDAAGAEVLRGEHAAGCHDADEGVEGGFVRVLLGFSKRPWR